MSRYWSYYYYYHHHHSSYSSYSSYCYCPYYSHTPSFFPKCLTDSAGNSTTAVYWCCHRTDRV